MGKVTRELIEYIFKNCTGHKLYTVLYSLFQENGENFDINAADSLVTLLEMRFKNGDGDLANWLDLLAGSELPVARYVRARMFGVIRNYDEALEEFSAVIKLLPKPDPFVLLHRARILVKMGQMAAAAEAIRMALQFYPPYSFFLKSEKLIEKIKLSEEWKPRRAVRIALLSSSTTTLLAPVLEASCFRDGIRAKTYQGIYGNYRQEILNPNSVIYKFNPDFVIIIPNQHDLVFPPNNVDTGAIDRIVADYRELWNILKHRNPCHVIHIGYDIPPGGAWGSLEDTLVGGRRRRIAEINYNLTKELPSGVSFIDINKIASSIGKGFFSAVEWYTAKQYPSSETLPLLSDHICAHIRGAAGLSSKVLVTDLDNTLWGGVIGEDGLQGIDIGPPSANGEGYLDLQKYLKELKEKGILLAVCSKNNLDDAKAPFENHDSMFLSLDDFVVFTANWDDKAGNIERMAQTLSLGLDSFVFLDDNPLERAWVRSSLPQVTVPECGSTPWEMLIALERGMYFESSLLTDEDTQRYKQYQANVKRKDIEDRCTSLEEFLLGLEMVAECGPIDEYTISRATQLINKTNQFNVTSKRYSEEQVKSIASSPEWWTRWYRLKDRFGDHGLIGVILVKKDGAIWHIDTWLMSCRILGRKMEEFMCVDLLTSADQANAMEVWGEYVPTVKNELVKSLYPSLGFTDWGVNTHVFRLKDNAIPVCQFIR
ncbi:MAG: HAD-IIIC family phosphatase [Bacillota bacterium]